MKHPRTVQLVRIDDIGITIYYREIVDWIVASPPHLFRRIGRFGRFIGLSTAAFFRWLL